MATNATEKKSRVEMLKEADTDEVYKLGKTFGENQEYYCLYLEQFYFKPWWFPNGIEFRPFRNVRMHRKYNNLTFHKVGYFHEWLLNPKFKYQVYTNGQPCENHTVKPTTFVTFLCGIENRVTNFRETKPCRFYELTFETSFNCKPQPPADIKNELAIKKVGKEDYIFMNYLAIAVGIFVLICFFLLILRKNRIY